MVLILHWNITFVLFWTHHWDYILHVNSLREFTSIHMNLYVLSEFACRCEFALYIWTRMNLICEFIYHTYEFICIIWIHMYMWVRKIHMNSYVFNMWIRIRFLYTNSHTLCEFGHHLCTNSHALCEFGHHFCVQIHICTMTNTQKNHPKLTWLINNNCYHCCCCFCNCWCCYCCSSWTAGKKEK